MRIFISCPESVHYNELLEAVKRCKDAGHTVNYWNRMRHSYDSSSIRRADVIVFLLPNNNWSIDIDDLPMGIHKEMNQAMDLDKKIAIAYKARHTGNMQIYEAKIIDDIIFTGVASTYGYETRLESDGPDYITERPVHPSNAFNPNGFMPPGPIPGKPYTVKGKIEFSDLGIPKCKLPVIGDVLEYDPHLLLMLL